MNTTKKMDGGTVGAGHGTDMAACGGGKKWWKERQAAASRLNLANHIRREVLSSDNEWVPFDDIYDLGGGYIELKEGGACDFCMEDDIKGDRVDAGQ